MDKPKKKIKFNVKKQTKFLPDYTVFGGPYGIKHFIRMNKKTGKLQYKKGDKGDPNIKGAWKDVSSQGITLEQSKEHRGFGLPEDKNYRHYVIDKAPPSLKKKKKKFNVVEIVPDHPRS